MTCAIVEGAVYTVAMGLAFAGLSLRAQEPYIAAVGGARIRTPLGTIGVAKDDERPFVALLPKDAPPLSSPSECDTEPIRACGYRQGHQGRCPDLTRKTDACSSILGCVGHRRRLNHAASVPSRRSPLAFHVGTERV